MPDRKTKQSTVKYSDFDKRLLDNIESAELGEMLVISFTDAEIKKQFMHLVVSYNNALESEKRLKLTFIPSIKTDGINYISRKFRFFALYANAVMFGSSHPEYVAKLEKFKRS